MKPSDFDYDLPEERIAQRPAATRDGSRLLVLRRDPGGATSPGSARTPELEALAIDHGLFRDLGRYLAPGDLLVLNDTRVIPARLVGTKESGGRIEVLLVEREGAAPPDSLDPSDGPDEGAPDAETWLCLAGFSRTPEPGMRLDLGPDLEARYMGSGPGRMHRVSLASRNGNRLRDVLKRAGRVPLPPYIRRNGAPDVAAQDQDRYQTVYARVEGAIAAPTAGLHFTERLLETLRGAGIRIARTTLHVGPATFLSVDVEEIEDHPMPAERYAVPAETVDAVAGTRARRGRVVAVGTTAVRALESASDGCGGIVPARGRTDLFVTPGYRFRVVDALITNFHLPRSTLLMLVCAFGGRERVLDAYREAVVRGYRFYSYGDAMLVL